MNMLLYSCCEVRKVTNSMHSKETFIAREAVSFQSAHEIDTVAAAARIRYSAPPSCELDYSTLIAVYKNGTDFRIRDGKIALESCRNLRN